ncbi:hypothetical protein Mgra_00005711 [Meloidogyne graminicola]|uniref:Uncharacterized protein n=1 Tax=Meloidogyne graminicola TaxID=189291 RepID=A0A8S9ZNS3_9BILA|nr:hypothetical protein Mgra_00005711 [Meloidogyne graminicola]
MKLMKKLMKTIQNGINIINIIVLKKDY